ncbi:hypothetical protein Agabi119p4_4952 [Agaricus bisporus var. burnettii]|uniref:Uncharacterized protein n=1 Tax=Agaricus bisporus var. burnettii TaxID=192524 RepID=A0A8H7F4L2_AGABI|nr:hypothetical protein Agabi119p4_4952 [Agaricus bisporus var. burnettii]
MVVSYLKRFAFNPDCLSNIATISRTASPTSLLLLNNLPTAKRFEAGRIRPSPTTPSWNSRCYSSSEMEYSVSILRLLTKLGALRNEFDTKSLPFQSILHGRRLCLARSRQYHSSRNMKNSVKCDITNTARTRSVKLDFPFSDNRDFIRTPHGNVLKQTRRNSGSSTATFAFSVGLDFFGLGQLLLQ